MDHRIGLVVPSSNVTIETELPRLFASQPGRTFSFHSSRMKMLTVSDDGLATMNAAAERCIDEISDANVDVIVYGCLVAIMAQGRGDHRRVEAFLNEQLQCKGSPSKLISSAGALLDGLTALSAERIALVMPYVQPLAEKVVDYIEAEGFQVRSWIALEEADNCAVGQIESARVLEAARSLDLNGVDALVLSACVQMPSLDAIETCQHELGVPVLSATTATAHAVLKALDVKPTILGAGQLLASAPITV